MKKATIVLIAVLLTLTSFGQWAKSTKNDAFNGNYKYTTVTGYGGSFPYGNPYLIIRKYDNEEPEIYISDMGSMACDPANVQIAIDGNVFKFDLSSSTDGDAGFLSLSKSSEVVELLNAMKNGSTAILRFTTRCSQNTFKINLSGSTSGLNHVIGDYFEVKAKADELYKIKRDSIQFIADEIKRIAKIKKDSIQFISDEIVRLAKIKKDSLQVVYTNNLKAEVIIWKDSILKDIDLVYLKYDITYSWWARYSCPLYKEIGEDSLLTKEVFTEAIFKIILKRQTAERYIENYKKRKESFISNLFTAKEDGAVRLFGKLHNGYEYMNGREMLKEIDLTIKKKVKKKKSKKKK